MREDPGECPCLSLAGAALNSRAIIGGDDSTKQAHQSWHENNASFFRDLSFLSELEEEIKTKSMPAASAQTVCSVAVVNTHSTTEASKATVGSDGRIYRSSRSVDVRACDGTTWV